MDHPLKKRKLYDPPPPPPPPSQPPPPPSPPPPPPPPSEESAPPPPPPPPPPPQTPPQLPPEEVHRRLRHQEEIRAVYENYKTIKRCIALANGSRNSARHIPELEQAYLSLISSSRGCCSVQRILSEFIPRYASYCPTALEAAVQVVINMHNWNVHVISCGEDIDGVAFQTVKNCVIGLVEICYAASVEAPSSSVIQGICSAVFLNVATFFASSLEGKDILQMIGTESLKMQDSNDTFTHFKQRILQEGASPLLKLLKFRALCLLRILFLCPKDLIGACFELFSNCGVDGLSREGKYFLGQLFVAVNLDAVCFDQENEASKVSEASSSYMDVDAGVDDGISRKPGSDPRQTEMKKMGLLKCCLLGLVLQRNPSLKNWIFQRYWSLQKSAAPEAVSRVKVAFEGTFESFAERLRMQVLEDIDDGSDRSMFVSRQYFPSSTSNQRSPIGEMSRKDSRLKLQGKSCTDELIHSGHYLKRQGSTVSHENDHHSNGSYNSNSGSSKRLTIDCNEQGDTSHAWLSKRRAHHGEGLFSPAVGKHAQIKKGPHRDKAGVNSFGLSIGVTESSVLGSASAASFSSTSHQVVWYSDGDPAAMDVFSASHQLWLGSLALDISEAAVRFECERFGPVENLSFFPSKAFALVYYRNILDAAKAREYMRRYSPWGYPVRVKFMDVGMGTRGALNGVAVGSSCHVYVGNILSLSAKDEILREIVKAMGRAPRQVTELTSEGALLLEFNSPEEAANAMAFMRQFRWGSSNLTPSSGAGTGDMSRSHPTYWSTAPNSFNSPLGNAYNTMIGSPNGPTFASPSNRMHHTASSFKLKPEGVSPSFASPRPSFENQGFFTQGGQVPQMNLPSSGCSDTPGISRSQGSLHGPSEQMWMYQKQEFEHQPAPGPVTGTSIATQQPVIVPPQSIQPTLYMQPIYPPSNSSWDLHGLTHHAAFNPMPPTVTPSGMHSISVPPYAQASVAPSSQVQSSVIQPYGQMVPQPIAPPILLSMPTPQSAMPPPLPPSPPVVPPPPRSPPPPPPTDETLKAVSMGGSVKIEWQGTLSKSGVHYCTIFGHRVDSDTCKYSTSVSEPTGWPVKLDMTKRTDIRHVRTTFSNTPPHRREVCVLVPSSVADRKGFADFVSYLKQRDCAGVIKIPSMKSLWARLLFILPYSTEICSMLSIKPIVSDCLIAVILPKEANSE